MTECIVWPGAKTGQGYGHRSIGGRSFLAHRVAYEASRGPIPTGLEIDHLCRNRACINPDHLEPVTHAENVRRQMAVITACPKGHEYTPDNTYRDPRGHRQCRVCRRDSDRRYRGVTHA